MNRLAAAAAGLAVAATGLAMTPGTAYAESNGGLRIMPLGDSITEGVDVPGAYRVGLWQRLTAGQYRNDFVGSQFNGPNSLSDHDHEGHPGWRIDQVDAEIVGWLRSSKPHSVLLHIGTNDVLNANASTAPDRLSALIDHITATVPDAEVFVAMIIPMGWTAGDDAIQAYNNKIPGIVRSKAADGKHVHLVNMHDALSWSDLGPDSVHPTANGYDKMAAVWYSALRSVPGALDEPSKPPSKPGKPGKPSKPKVDWVTHHALPVGGKARTAGPPVIFRSTSGRPVSPSSGRAAGK
jgi:lysophospholipase L1-like esterase